MTSFDYGLLILAALLAQTAVGMAFGTWIERVRVMRRGLRCVHGAPWREGCENCNEEHEDDYDHEPFV